MLIGPFTRKRLKRLDSSRSGGVPVSRVGIGPLTLLRLRDIPAANGSLPAGNFTRFFSQLEGVSGSQKLYFYLTGEY